MVPGGSKEIGGQGIYRAQGIGSGIVKLEETVTRFPVAADV